MLRIITILVATVAAFLIPQFADFYVSLVILMLYHCCVGIAWNILMGYAGMLSLGNAIFSGIGSFTMALILIHTDLPWFMVIPLCAVSGGLVGAGISCFSHIFGLRGTYFTLMTILFLQITRLATESNDFFGATGGLFIPSGKLNVSLEVIFYTFCITLALFIFLQSILLKSKLGLNFQAMRDEPEAAASIGVSLKNCKIFAMTISGAMTGVAGGILCIYYKNIFASHIFNNFTSIEILLPVILGGLGTRYGPIFGSVIFIGLSELINHFIFEFNLDIPGVKQMIYGFLIFIMIIFFPKGVKITLPNWAMRYAKCS